MMIPFLEMNAASPRRFPGVKALDHVDLQALRRARCTRSPGRTAPASRTLMKIMTGVLRADPGGRSSSRASPSTSGTRSMRARSASRIIYQELSMVENLTVAENIFLAREPLNRRRLVDSAA